MIFVTVGTHEQPFDRLIKCIDQMVADGKIKEEVIIQKGYTDYEPQNCTSYKLIGYDDIKKYIEEARIVVTHGGPASFVAPLSIGKIPIVVPRQYKYNEHVNNHQLEFIKFIDKKMGIIIPIYNIEELENSILDYDSKIKDLKINSVINNKIFCEKFEKIVYDLFKKKGDKNEL